MSCPEAHGTIRGMEPSAETTHVVTELLQAWRRGEDVGEQLMELVYTELSSLAGRYLSRERSGHTLEARDLVHEAYLRLVDQREVDWQSRSHFFALAALTMRRILLDHARAKTTGKRGAGRIRIPLLEELATVAERPLEAIDLRRLLERLGARDSRLAEVVDLHFFAGLTLEETARVLGSSRRTVARNWALARAWLVRELSRA